MKLKKDITIIIGYREMGRLLAQEPFDKLAQVLNSLGDHLLKQSTTPNLSTHMIGDKLDSFGGWFVKTTAKGVVNYEE